MLKKLESFKNTRNFDSIKESRHTKTIENSRKNKLIAELNKEQESLDNTLNDREETYELGRNLKFANKSIENNQKGSKETNNFPKYGKSLINNVYLKLKFRNQKGSRRATILY